jgi:hypothetical protein
MTTLAASPRSIEASAIDRVIRISTAIAVLAVAGVAAYVSYWHAYAVVRAHGESGLTARLEPATIDGLVYASSMVILYAARHGSSVPRLARWLLGLGIAATLTANMAQGWADGPVGAAVAAWPAVSLVGSYELLVWLIRTAGEIEHGLSSKTFCRGPEGDALTLPSAAKADATGNSRTESSPVIREQLSACRLSGQEARRDDIPSQEGADGDVNDAAVDAYRMSVQVGNPLSERKLAYMFGRTSRRWARARIAEARQVLAASLYGDRAAELHEDVSDRIREHLALPTTPAARSRRSSPRRPA